MITFAHTESTNELKMLSKAPVINTATLDSLHTQTYFQALRKWIETKISSK